MKKYIIKRILTLIPVLFIVSVIVFSLVHLTPGNPAALMLGDNASPEDIAALTEQMGLNDPLPLQYLHWLNGVFHGDLGNSVIGNEPVTSVLANRFAPTLSLAVIAIIVALIVSIPLGILGAKKRGTFVDFLVNGISLAGISIPGFLLGLLLMMLICVQFRLLPVSGYRPITDGFWQHIRYLILPGIALGFTQAALMMRMTKASMLEVLNSDYMKMAKAKGVKEFFLLVKHGLRNALVSITTIIGQSLIAILSGSAVIETLFGIPGMGSLIVSSIGRRDYEVIQGVVLVIAVINVGISLVVDLIYGLIDPRIRLS